MGSRNITTAQNYHIEILSKFIGFDYPIVYQAPYQRVCPT